MASYSRNNRGDPSPSLDVQKTVSDPIPQCTNFQGDDDSGDDDLNINRPHIELEGRRLPPPAPRGCRHNRARNSPHRSTCSLPIHLPGVHAGNLATNLAANKSTVLDFKEHSGEGPGPEDFEAAFVVFWPSKEYKPSISIPVRVNQTPNGIIAIWDSVLANEWIDGNYYNPLLVLMRKSKIGGPISTMLSIDTVALALFGTMSAYIIKLAEQLASLSGFPVVVRPVEENPSLFRNHTPADTPDQSSGGYSAMHGGAQQVAVPYQNQGFNHLENRQYQENSVEHPALPPVQFLIPSKATKPGLTANKTDLMRGEPEDPNPLPSSTLISPEKAVHKMDVQLNFEDDGEYLRLITNTMLFPPNTPIEKDGTNKVVHGPSIEGHVELEVCTGDSVTVDKILGSLGFLATDIESLQTERIIHLGYGPQPFKAKRTRNEQKSKTLSGTIGIAGEKLTALFQSTIGKSTTSGTEIINDQIAKKWEVIRQRISCNWQTNTSVYRGIKTQIHRSSLDSSDTDPLDDRMAYGISVEVAKPINEMTTPVAFLYQHQVHCWVPSKSRQRGLIMLASHFITDIRAEPLTIMRTITLDLDVDNGTGNGVPHEAQLPLPAHSLPKHNFVVAAARLPEQVRPALKARVQQAARWTRDMFKQPQEVPTVSLSPLMTSGSHRPAGWDHLNMKWYGPIWPELTERLESQKAGSRAGWKLDCQWTDGPSAPAKLTLQN